MKSLSNNEIDNHLDPGSASIGTVVVTRLYEIYGRFIHWFTTPSNRLSYVFSCKTNSMLWIRDLYGRVVVDGLLILNVLVLITRTWSISTGLLFLIYFHCSRRFYRALSATILSPEESKGHGLKLPI